MEAPSSQALPSFPPLAVCEESLGTRVVQRYLYRIVNNWLVFIGVVVHCCVAMITVSKNRRKNAFQLLHMASVMTGSDKFLIGLI